MQNRWLVTSAISSLGRPKGQGMMLVLQPRGLMKPDNLILLCRVHHKIIDDQTQTYSNRSQPTANVDYESLASSLYGISSKRWIDLLRLDGGDAGSGWIVDGGVEVSMAN